MIWPKIFPTATSAGLKSPAHFHRPEIFVRTEAGGKDDDVEIVLLAASDDARRGDFLDGIALQLDIAARQGIEHALVGVDPNWAGSHRREIGNHLRY